MSKLNVCFVGIGSIAKRHIRNLHQICAESGIELQTDAFRRKKIISDGIDNIYTEPSEVPNDYDVIFITNPTELHLDTLTRFHDKGKHFHCIPPAS